MSLDVYLRMEDSPASSIGSGIFVREGGAIKEITREEWNARYPGREPVVVERHDSERVYSANITRNLSGMATEAGIYEYLWRPEEIGVKKAQQLIAPLRDGLTALKSDPKRFKKLNPKNGWGDYDGFVEFVTDYLAACERYPDAEVSVWR